MKKILIRTFAFIFLTAGTITSCKSENTTGVETEGNIESQPNMGGKTGNAVGIDSIATEEGDTTNGGTIDNQ